MKDKAADASAPNNEALTRKVRYATFNTRLLAAAVDITIITLIALPVSQWLQGVFYQPINVQLFAAVLSSTMPNVQMNDAFWALIRQEHVVQKIFINNLLQLSLVAFYILPFWFKKHTTPGKALMGIEIRDATTYELMTHKQMVLRFFGYIISGIPLTLGFMWMGFNKKRRCWHDFMAHTIVVKKEKKPKE